MGARSDKETANFKASQRKKNVSDKLAPKGQSHRIAQQQTGEFTPAQRLMRDEMAQGVHQPQRISDVIDAVVGNTVQGEGKLVSEQLALEIINEHGAGLRTNLADWAIIQNMIEIGIRRGIQIGSK